MQFTFLISILLGNFFNSSVSDFRYTAKHLPFPSPEQENIGYYMPFWFCPFVHHRDQVHRLIPFSVPFRSLHLCRDVSRAASGTRRRAGQAGASLRCYSGPDVASLLPSKGIDGGEATPGRCGWWLMVVTGWLTVAALGVYTRYSPILIGASACHAGVRNTAPAGACPSRTCVKCSTLAISLGRLSRRSSTSPSTPWPLLFLEYRRRRSGRAPQSKSLKVPFLKDLFRTTKFTRSKGEKCTYLLFRA